MNNNSSNIIKNKDLKDSKNELIKENNSNSNFENIYNDLYVYSEISDLPQENSKKTKRRKSLSDLEIDNFKDFNEEDYSEV